VQTVDREVEVTFNPSRSIILTNTGNSARISISRRSTSKSTHKRENEVQDIRILDSNICHPVYEHRGVYEMSFHMD